MPRETINKRQRAVFNQFLAHLRADKLHPAYLRCFVFLAERCYYRFRQLGAGHLGLNRKAYQYIPRCSEILHACVGHAEF